MQLLLTTQHSASGQDAGVTSHEVTHLVRPGQSLICGRDKDRAQILVGDDEAVSGCHFRLTCSADGGALTDLESRNGTYVNGHRVTSTALKPGDHIAAGNSHFTVAFDTAADSSAAASEAAADDGEITAQRQLTLQILKPGQGGDTTVSQWLSVYLFPGDQLSLGRVAARSDIAIANDGEMSGTHLQFSLQQSSCRVTDLHSTNGSFLNGLQFSDELIRHGDEVRAGRTYILVSLNEGDQQSAAAWQATMDSEESRRRRQQDTLNARGYRIVNSTPFSFAPLTGQIASPQRSLTLIVKGTFQFCHGEAMQPAEEQLFATADLPYADVDDPSAPPRYESDFAFAKPRADILVVGHCHAPHGHPVGKLTAAVTVGTLSRTLEVYGEREWQKSAGRWEQSQPTPFSSLELRYEHSFGGPDCDANRVGTGDIGPQNRPPGHPVRAPRIVARGTGTRTPQEDNEPAGFGPEPRYSGRRRQELGTFDEEWEKTRWPWFPADFCWDHFNAAQAPQQMSGFLRGDEVVELRNLHAQHPQYQTQLPGVRVRCFVNPVGRMFCEVPMSADTLWLDMDAEQAVIVWRGHIAVESEECRDLRHVYIMSQRLDEEPLSANECHSLLLNELNQRDAQFRPPAEIPPDDSADSGGNSAAAADASTEEQQAAAALETELTRIKSEVRAAQVQRGIDPDLFDRQVQAEAARLTEAWKLDAELPLHVLEFKVASELWEMQKRVHDAKIAAGLTPDPLPPEPRPPADPQPELPEDASADAEAGTAGWTRQKVETHHQKGNSFAGENLSNLDLSGLDLSGADFQKAILAKTRMSQSTLNGCNLTLANLAGADLTESQLAEATLTDADLSGAILHKAVLDGAVAGGAVFADAWLTGLSMVKANAPRASFVSADLTGADLTDSNLENADFSASKLGQCQFIGASLTESRLGSAVGPAACFDRANLQRVRGAGCNLMNASLQQVQAQESIWEGARLASADFSYAQMNRVNLIKANLSQAVLHATDLTAARLTSASLVRAKLTESKLLDADIGQADLRAADVSGSCLYGAQLHGANWKDCRRAEVNWKKTQQPAEDEA